MHEVLQTIQSNGRTAVTDLGALIERHSDVTGTVTLERVSLLRRQYVDVIKESLVGIVYLFILPTRCCLYQFLILSITFSS